MVSSLGHGVEEIIEAAREQAREVSFIYNQQFTSPAQEELADRVAAIAPPELNRVRFTSGGAEANEAALRMLRSFHVEKGQPARVKTISPAQSYHGPTMATLGLSGRPAMRAPYDPLIQNQLHIPPSTWRCDPSGKAALAAFDAHIATHGAESIAAFVCEPISAAALPAYSPPSLFWDGLAERRDAHGFLIVLDEVVTGMGRTGTWFAAEQLPLTPDIITTAKGLGAGFAPIGAVLAADHVYEAVAEGSGLLEAGHTWDGAPLPCAVGIAVLDHLERHKLIDRVRSLGPEVLDKLTARVSELDLVREVRGRGFLLGVEYVDPRDGESFIPPELGVARGIDKEALRQGLIVYSTQPTSDGYVGDQTLLAPAFVSTDEELDTMVERMTTTISNVERRVKAELA